MVKKNEEKKKELINDDVDIKKRKHLLLVKRKAGIATIELSVDTPPTNKLEIYVLSDQAIPFLLISPNHSVYYHRDT